MGQPMNLSGGSEPRPLTVNSAPTNIVQAEIPHATLPPVMNSWIRFIINICIYIYSPEYDPHPCFLSRASPEFVPKVQTRAVDVGHLAPPNTPKIL